MSPVRSDLRGFEPFVGLPRSLCHTCVVGRTLRWPHKAARKFLQRGVYRRNQNNIAAKTVCVTVYLNNILQLSG